MMERVTLEKLRALRVLPEGASGKLEAFYAQAAANSDLSLADYLTLRDLLELSGYRDEALHALLLCLFAAMNGGNLSIVLSEQALAARLGVILDAPAASEYSRGILDCLQRNAFPELIGAASTDGRPVVRIIRGGQTRLYFQKFLKHEETLSAFLAARLQQRASGSDLAPAPPVAASAESKILAEVLEENPLLVDGKALAVNAEQKAALHMALQRDFVVISGGPGTGKTFLVFTLLRCLLRAGFEAERIRLAAPTGRAARRMTDFIRSGMQRLRRTPDEAGADARLREIAGSTVHRLLKYNPARGTFLYGAEHSLPADVVIVDEVSMLDVALMARLLAALPPSAKLILLGDRDQLPSVEAGAVLAGLMPRENAASVIILEHNYRSQQHIVAVARRVNQKDTRVVDELPRLNTAFLATEDTKDTEASLQQPVLRGEKCGCWLLDATDGGPAAWRDVLDAWVEFQYLKQGNAESYSALLRRCDALTLDATREEHRALLAQLFERLEAARVLTLIREGSFGSSGVNAHCEAALRGKLDPRADTAAFSRLGEASGVAWTGAPILILRNEHSMQLYNGDVGIILRDREAYRAVFQISGGYASFPLDSLPPHELAFAITVHKSQGSEYGQVLLAVPPDETQRLLSKEIIYTAITRAKDLVVIYGRPEILKKAIRQSIEREPSLGPSA